MKLFKIFVTLSILGAAGWFGWQKWRDYTANPWTRDGQVRTQVVQITPRVSGMVTNIHVVDNQHVNQGDLLFEIDPSTYILKVRQAKARLRRALETSRGMKVEYERLNQIYTKDPGAASQKDLVRN